jgi:hypothetical protein
MGESWYNGAALLDLNSSLFIVFCGSNADTGVLLALIAFARFF